MRVPRSKVFALTGSVIVGALVTLQTAINGELAHRLGTGARAGVLAAAISFGTGLAVLTIALLLLPSWRAQLRRLHRTSTLARWKLLGGTAGALLVASQGITVSTIGVSLFVVAIVAGSTASALWVDHIGLGPAGRSHVSALRVIGALITLIAVIVSTGVLTGSIPSHLVLWLALLPLLAGAATSVQQAINGQVAIHSSAGVATWNNFLVGWIALVIAFAMSHVLPGAVLGLPSAPWLYLGGLIGVAFIATASIAVRVIGVLTFGLASVCGQVSTALVVDLIVAPDQVKTSTYVAAALTLIGVAVVASARRSS